MADDEDDDTPKPPPKPETTPGTRLRCNCCSPPFPIIARGILHARAAMFDHIEYTQTCRLL